MKSKEGHGCPMLPSRLAALMAVQRETGENCLLKHFLPFKVVVLTLLSVMGEGVWRAGIHIACLNLMLLSCMLHFSLAEAGCGQETFFKLERFWASSYRKQRSKDLSQHWEVKRKQEEVEVIS